jgi:hypothetical protein
MKPNYLKGFVMRNKIAAIKTHIDQNSHNLRDLAIATGALVVTTVAIIKVCGSDSNTIDLS